MWAFLKPNYELNPLGTISFELSNQAEINKKVYSLHTLSLFKNN